MRSYDPHDLVLFPLQHGSVNPRVRTFRRYVTTKGELFFSCQDPDACVALFAPHGERTGRVFDIRLIQGQTIRGLRYQSATLACVEKATGFRFELERHPTVHAKIVGRVT